MKRSLLLISLFFPFYANAQVFYTETFDGTVCAAGSGCDPSLVSWTTTNTGANGATANKWYVSDTESGMAAGQCGTAGMNDQSLHVGNVPGSTFSLICPTGDCGAAYDASSAAEITDKRCESPVINCTGQSGITLAFNYIENGQGTLDDATLWYFDGATWAQIDPLAKTVNNCGGQGRWTAFSIALPASANNNPGVRIGFRWVNNGDGMGSDPSFAVDDITLSTSVVGAPVASFTMSQNNICAGTCINFTNTSTGAPFTSVSWNFGGGAVPNTSSVNSPSNICFNTAGTYTITLTVTNANGTNSITQNLIVLPQPVASFTASQTNICVNDCINFTNTSTGGPFNLTGWSFTGSSTATSTTNNPTNICYPTVGSFPATLIVMNGTCGDTISQTINVTTCSLPPVSSFTPSSTTVCVGDPVTFTDNSTNGPTSWSWLFPSGTPANSTAQNPTVTWSTAGTYTVSLTASNGVGAGNTATVNITVVVCAGPNAAFTPSATGLCVGDCITFSNTSTGASSYSWTFSGGTPASSTAQNPGTVCYSTPGTYAVTLIASSGGNSDTLVTTITVGSLPTITASADTLIDLGQSVQLFATGSGGGTYLWTPSSGLSCTACQNPIATPSNTTSYIVYYTENGCTVSDTVVVSVTLIEGIGVPTAFSPNGSGLNDQLFVLGQGITKMKFTVYNRYGQQVFISESQQEGWDGTHNGKPVNTGVFVWYLDYTLVSGASGTLKGNVTLIR